MALFQPITVGSTQLDHRVVMAPLTRMRCPNHVPTDLNAEYYEQRSRRPGTLIITEATFISEAAGGYPDAPGIWSNEQIAGWKKIFDAIKANKSKAFVQLWALGRQVVGTKASAEKLDPSFRVVSATDGEFNGVKTHGLTKDEINDYVRAYAQAAKNAIAAGADGVEIHGAHGYLLDQFLHASCNTRTDEYGGSIENRARFVLEVVDAITDAIGADKVGIRLSPWITFSGMDPAITGSSPIPQFSYVISEFQARANKGRGLAYIHIVEPRVAGTIDTNQYDAALSDLNGFVRNVWDGVIVRSGGMLKHAKAVTDADDRTIVGFGRFFISNPDLVDRLEKGHELNKYVRRSFYTPGPKGYIDYPRL